MCQTPLPAPYLDLGEQPLANALIQPGLAPTLPDEARFPLQVILCEQCGLSQLSVVVNPEILYSGYRFRSGASEGWVKHCEELAKRCTKEWDKFPPGSVLDIAANDGTQLKAFATRGWACVGVDPSPVMDTARGHIIKGFWNADQADLLLKIHGPQDLIIAQNVLGHVDDPIAFLRACKTVLAPEGRVVVEAPDVDPLIDSCAFDTVYHEHLSYWSPYPLAGAAWEAGLAYVGSEVLSVHGGSRRYWLRHAVNADEGPASATAPLCRPAREPYATFAHRVEENLAAMRLLTRHDARNRALGWGASAKAAVYLNALVVAYPLWAEGYPPAIIDETPEKQGLLLPGVHIPIIPPPSDLSDVDVIWVLSWNNWEAISRKAKERGFKGKFLLTHPGPRLIDA